MMKSFLFWLNIVLLWPVLAEPEIPERLVEVALQRLDQHHLAFTMRHHPHWHTYWKNPGAAGLPTEIQIKGLEALELEWPAPQTHREQADVITFGYEGEITRFFEVKKVLSEKIELKARWLVCRHICIPGEAKISALWPKGGALQRITPPNPFEVAESELRQRKSNLPALTEWPNELDIKLLQGTKDKALSLLYRRPNDFALSKGYDLLIPFSHSLLTMGFEQLKTDTLGMNGRLDIEWDGEYREPPVAFPQSGKFDSPLKLKFLYRTSPDRVLMIEKVFTSFSKDTQLLEEFERIPSKTADAPASGPGRHFLFYLLLAFVGGLILNVMPCVLPVISLKLFHLVGHSDESPRMILKHNLFYTLGVLCTFLLLGLVIIALKASGESVGWGFQLQSPHFVAIMAVFLFVLGLNLFGLFEFHTPGGKVFGDLQIKQGVWGDFASGVLATILATPCSAPFLGTALTFALASNQSGSTILLVFIFIGLGLAFPFIVTGFFPGSISLLPRPGAWMEKLKKFLALTLFLSVLWLLDVFMSLVDAGVPVIQLHTALLFIFFAFYLRKNITRNIYLQGLSFAIPTLLLFQIHLRELPNPFFGSVQSSLRLNWIPWSREQMQKQKEQKNLVFINFTAKWCLTCKVNEKLVFSTRAFSELARDKKMTLLKGDWTKRDPQISDFLKENGFVGVPAYFLQSPEGKLIPLGEMVTYQKIHQQIEALE